MRPTRSVLAQGLRAYNFVNLGEFYSWKPWHLLPPELQPAPENDGAHPVRLGIRHGVNLGKLYSLAPRNEFDAARRRTRNWAYFEDGSIFIALDKYDHDDFERRLKIVDHLVKEPSEAMAAMVLARRNTSQKQMCVLEEDLLQPIEFQDLSTLCVSARYTRSGESLVPGPQRFCGVTFHLDSTQSYPISWTLRDPSSFFPRKPEYTAENNTLGNPSCFRGTLVEGVLLPNARPRAPLELVISMKPSQHLIGEGREFIEGESALGPPRPLDVVDRRVSRLMRPLDLVKRSGSAPRKPKFTLNRSDPVPRMLQLLKNDPHAARQKYSAYTTPPTAQWTTSREGPGGYQSRVPHQFQGRRAKMITWSDPDSRHKGQRPASCSKYDAARALQLEPQEAQAQLEARQRELEARERELEQKEEVLRWKHKAWRLQQQLIEAKRNLGPQSPVRRVLSDSLLDGVHASDSMPTRPVARRKKPSTVPRESTASATDAIEQESQNIKQTLANADPDSYLGFLNQDETLPTDALELLREASRKEKK
ncbi:hypothetical protein EJ07DRAFT_150300 [Lizonia empirigonia]|nr:hypothetical protein EJ07DRAFT_150300 [Lizonia empirigonia]